MIERNIPRIRARGQCTVQELAEESIGSKSSGLHSRVDIRPGTPHGAECVRQHAKCAKWRKVVRELDFSNLTSLATNTVQYEGIK